MNADISVLSVGGMSGYDISNTCLHRTWALEACSARVDKVDTRQRSVNLRYRLANKLFHYHFPIPLPDLSKANQQILALVRNQTYDVLWIDKGITINKNTLIEAKKTNPSMVIVGYSPDEMTRRHNQSFDFIRSLPYYDYYVITKSYAVEEIGRASCRERV